MLDSYYRKHDRIITYPKEGEVPKMRVMRILVELIILAAIIIAMVSIGVIEAQDKQDKTERAIKEGLAAICRESGDHIWNEESGQCIRLVFTKITSDREKTINGDEE